MAVAYPATVLDALVPPQLGRRTFRGNDAVTGGELIGGLRQSGFTVARVGWRLERLAADGRTTRQPPGRSCPGPHSESTPRTRQSP
jgi:hypothetical protein